MLIKKLKNNIKPLIPNIYNTNKIPKFKFFTKSIYSRNIFTLKNNKNITYIQNFNFSNESDNKKEKIINKDLRNMTKKDIEDLNNKNISDKLDRIFKKEIDSNKSNQKDKEYVLKKIKNLHDLLIYLKIPVLISIYPLAFSNVFSANYSILIFSVNNYMILLTLFDSSLFFAAGILNYLLNFKVLIPDREKKSFRRLSQSFLFFTYLLYTAKLANDYLNIHSLFMLLFANFYLFFKAGIHINLNLFTRDYIIERMENINYNIFLCIALILIVYWKGNIYKQLI